MEEPGDCLDFDETRSARFDIHDVIAWYTVVFCNITTNKPWSSSSILASSNCDDYDYREGAKFARRRRTAPIAPSRG